MNRSVKDIIKACGGEKAINARCGLNGGVRHWHRIGIPDVYWPVLMSMDLTLTADELLRANIQARTKTRDASSPVPVAVAGVAAPAYCPPIGADSS